MTTKTNKIEALEEAIWYNNLNTGVLVGTAYANKQAVHFLEGTGWRGYHIFKKEELIERGLEEWLSDWEYGGVYVEDFEGVAMNLLLNKHKGAYKQAKEELLVLLKEGEKLEAKLNKLKASR